MNPWLAYLLGVMTVPAIVGAIYALMFLRYFGIFKRSQK